MILRRDGRNFLVTLDDSLTFCVPHRHLAMRGLHAAASRVVKLDDLSTRTRGPASVQATDSTGIAPPGLDATPAEKAVGNGHGNDYEASRLRRAPCTGAAKNRIKPA